MLPMAEALLLFALHDEKGTVVSSAFLALDHALRGALLAELRLRGYVQSRTDDLVRVHPSPPGPPAEPVLAEAWQVVSTQTEPMPVGDVLAALERSMPEVRDALVADLARRGILAEAIVERMGLPDDVVHPMSDQRHEKDLRRTLILGLLSGDRVTPRVGTLIGLVVATHLEDDLFDDPQAARVRADWVSERDAVLRGVRTAVERVEGW